MGDDEIYIPPEPSYSSRSPSIEFPRSPSSAPVFIPGPQVGPQQRCLCCCAPCPSPCCHRATYPRVCPSDSRACSCRSYSSESPICAALSVSAPPAPAPALAPTAAAVPPISALPNHVLVVSPTIRKELRVSQVEALNFGEVASVQALALPGLTASLPEDLKLTSHTTHPSQRRPRIAVARQPGSEICTSFYKFGYSRSVQGIILI